MKYFIGISILLLLGAVTAENGNDICSPWKCFMNHAFGAIPWLGGIDWAKGQSIVGAMCHNLVGVYLQDERRTTCVQMATGDNAYKFDFWALHAGGETAAATLYRDTCANSMYALLDSSAPRDCGSYFYPVEWSGGSQDDGTWTFL
jgi:hypothetical protein